MIIKDITAGVKYTTKTGEEKTRWTNVGNLFVRDDGKMVVKIHAYINPLAFANEKGEVWFNVFDKKDEKASAKVDVEPEEKTRQRVMADGRYYSDKWRKELQGKEDIEESDGTVIDGVDFND